MTTEELKAHQIAVFTAIIEGKPVQHCPHYAPIEWFDALPTTAVGWLIDTKLAERIRIKPQTVWVGWPKNGNEGWSDTLFCNGSTKRDELRKGYDWQLVVKEVK